MGEERLHLKSKNTSGKGTKELKKLKDDSVSPRPYLTPIYIYFSLWFMI